MTIRLHFGGGWRRWLGARLGGDEALGDRAWRRILHCAGAGVLLYYVLPPRFLVVVSTEDALLLALAFVLALEAARHLGGLDLPTIREHERARVASYAYYAVALVVAVLLFPFPVALVAVLGTAFIDPLIGELRRSERARRLYPVLPFAAYAAMGAGGLVGLAAWRPLPAVLLATVAGTIAVAVERPRLQGLDDDLAMTLGPALAMEGLRLLAPGFFR